MKSSMARAVFLKLPAMLPRRKQKADAGKALLLDALSDTRDIALADVQKDWKALRLASVEMKRDREIVLAAVQQNWRALQYASDAMKGDREIVLAALEQSWRALIYASDAMKGDREIVLEASRKNAKAFEYASDELKNNPEVRNAIRRQEDEKESLRLEAFKGGIPQEPSPIVDDLVHVLIPTGMQSYSWGEGTGVRPVYDFAAAAFVIRRVSKWLDAGAYDVVIGERHRELLDRRPLDQYAARQLKFYKKNIICNGSSLPPFPPFQC